MKLIFLLILVSLSIVGWFFWLNGNASKEHAIENAKKMKFINDCVNSGKRVDMIGSVWAEQWMVCNPIK